MNHVYIDCLSADTLITPNPRLFHTRVLMCKSWKIDAAGFCSSLYYGSVIEPYGRDQYGIVCCSHPRNGSAGRNIRRKSCLVHLGSAAGHGSGRRWSCPKCSSRSLRVPRRTDAAAASFETSRRWTRRDAFVSF